MKKPFVLSIILALGLLLGSFVAPAHSQAPAKEDTPTFYRLTPGTYVNGYPRFTITYPKDWVEMRPAPQDTFRARAPGPSGTLPSFMVSVVHNPDPLERMAATLVMVFKMMSTDVTLVSDKSSQLRDGTPAREISLTFVQSGKPLAWLHLAAKKGDTSINVGMASEQGKLSADLKSILYSIEFQPDRDKPVEVPPDVEEFLQRSGNDILSHDVAKVMANYSDRYLNSGVRKPDVEQDTRRCIGTVTSLTGATTEFIPADDRAYLAGYTIINGGTYPFLQTAIIKEKGEWKWYGNQRDPVPVEASPR